MEILTSFIAHTEGAPYLENICVVLDDSYSDWDPLVAPLMEGGLPNLRCLMVHNIHGLTSNNLGTSIGDIYRMDGLARLIELHSENSVMDDDDMRAWLDGVRSSEHAGGMLEVLAFNTKHDPSDSLRDYYPTVPETFIMALSEGVYLNLQTLHDVYSVPRHPIMHEDWAAFVQAMRDGAPCARILRELRVGDPSIEPYQAELRSTLPRFKITIEH